MQKFVLKMIIIERLMHVSYLIVITLPNQQQYWCHNNLTLNLILYIITYKLLKLVLHDKLASRYKFFFHDIYADDSSS